MPPTTHPPRRSTARALLLLPREPVDIQLLPSAALTPAQRDDIWALYTRYYDYPRAQLEERVSSLPEIALYRAGSGALVGMTGVDVYRVRHEGRSSTVMYTGLVVVDERFRRQNLPLALGVRLFLRAKLRRPHERVDWLFGALSYKSYALLSRNLGVFWPRRDQPTPADTAAYIDFLARRRFGDAWQPARGVVARPGAMRLRPGTAPIDERRRADADVRFFETANAGHLDGELLVCLCPLTLENWAFVARNFLRRRRDVRARGRSIRRHSTAVPRPSLTTH